MDSLFNNIKSYHGRDMMDNASKFKKLRLSRAKMISNLNFLKNCRDNNLIPKFATGKHPLRLGRNLSTFKKLSETLIRNEIKWVRSKLIKMSQKLLSSHVYLSSYLRHELWQSLDAITSIKSEKWLTQDNNKKLKKLNNLHNNFTNYNSYSSLQVSNSNQIPILNNTLPKNINTQPLINSVDTINGFSSTHSRRQSSFNYHTYLAHNSLRGNNTKHNKSSAEQNKSNVKDLPTQKSSVGINGSPITQDLRGNSAEQESSVGLNDLSTIYSNTHDQSQCGNIINIESTRTHPQQLTTVFLMILFTVLR